MKLIEINRNKNYTDKNEKFSGIFEVEELDYECKKPVDSELKTVFVSSYTPKSLLYRAKQLHGGKYPYVDEPIENKFNLYQLHYEVNNAKLANAIIDHGYTGHYIRKSNYRFSKEDEFAKLACKLMLLKDISDDMRDFFEKCEGSETVPVDVILELFSEYVEFTDIEIRDNWQMEKMS